MIHIEQISITDLNTDAIVNAANASLRAGGGVCGAIFNAAGYVTLQSACDDIGFCETGSAVITPGFNLKSKYIIHAVGPIWNGGTQGEAQLLYDAYISSLKLAVSKGCHSIGFPLISSGIYGYPLKQAWKQAIQACLDFNSSCDIRIVFAVIDKHIYDTGVEILCELESSIPKSNSEQKKDKRCFEKLIISGREVNAVFFHLPDEPYGYLSNWYCSSFLLDGIEYSSMEQYIMYQKCILFGDYASAKCVLSTNDPSIQQKIGKSASGYNNNIWAGARQAIAIRGLIAKFNQNEQLKKMLLDTQDAFLVECAHSDTIWACGIRLNEAERLYADKWRGQNILGFSLMEVRKVISG